MVLKTKKAAEVFSLGGLPATDSCEYEWSAAWLRVQRDDLDRELFPSPLVHHAL
jgi:hypothetical protein